MPEEQDKTEGASPIKRRTPGGTKTYLLMGIKNGELSVIQEGNRKDFKGIHKKGSPKHDGFSEVFLVDTRLRERPYKYGKGGSKKWRDDLAKREEKQKAAQEKRLKAEAAAAQAAADAAQVEADKAAEKVKTAPAPKAKTGDLPLETTQKGGKP